MHFLVGWPAALQLPPLPPLAPAHQHQQTANGADASLPLSVAAIADLIRSVAHTRDRTHMAIVTDTALYLFHFQQVSGSNTADDNRSGRPARWRLLTSD